MTKNKLWLKTLRDNKKLTQEELAQTVGVTRQHIGLIENGIANPSPEVAKKLGKALGFDWTKFFEEENQEAI